MVINSMQFMTLIHDFIYEFMAINSYHTFDDLSIQKLIHVYEEYREIVFEFSGYQCFTSRSDELWPQVSHTPSHHWLTHRPPENSCLSSVQAVQHRKVCRSPSCSLLTPDIQPNLSQRTQQQIGLIFRTPVQVLSPEVFEPYLTSPLKIGHLNLHSSRMFLSKRYKLDSSEAAKEMSGLV